MRNKLAKYIIDPLLDRIPVELKNNLLGFHRYSLTNKIHPKDPDLLIQNIDKGHISGGITDRFKGIISGFAYCICVNRNYKIRHIWPFKLEDYLDYNLYNWIIDAKTEISDNFFEVKYFPIGGGKTSQQRLFNLTKNGKQIQAFFGGQDYVPLLNRHYQKDLQWGQLFNQLFKPKAKLKEKIESKLSVINGQFVAIVFRFQNLLGDFQEYNFPELNKTEQTKIINKCIDQLITFQQKNHFEKILVTSDSFKFLKLIEHQPNIYTFPEKIVHVDNTEDQSYEIYAKSFFDFFMISKATHIYSFETGDMYSTDFPRYAAKLENVPFRRIKF